MKEITLRKPLVVCLIVLAVAAAACDTQPSNNTTPTTQLKEVLAEAELEAVHIRTGLGFVEAEKLVYQSDVTAPTLTFDVGSACTGQITKPVPTEYNIKVFPRDHSETIIDATIPVGDIGALVDGDLAKVKSKCPA